MPRLKTALIFAGWFVLIYGLLITPWPGAKTIYAGYFRCVARLVLTTPGSQGLLAFQPLDNPHHQWPPNFDTAIILTNRDLLDQDGREQRFMLAVDAWQMGWAPTACLVSFTLATPIPWRRRKWALFWGLLWVHAFILLTLGIFIWNESVRLNLVALTPFWKEIANRLEEQALNPVGPSFFAAALIWLLITFRRQDLTVKPPIP
jgi:hypothetical protein